MTPVGRRAAVLVLVALVVTSPVLAEISARVVPSPLQGTGLTPEGLPEYVGNPALAAGLGHRLETVSLRGSGPAASLTSVGSLAYDAATSSFFVATPPYNVTVVSDPSLAVSATVPVGTDPFGVAVDNVTNEVYVTNNGSANVSVISDSSLRVTATVPVGSNPEGLAFDPTDNEVFVADSGSDTVTVISGSTHVVIATVAVGSEPVGVAYDPSSGHVFVANFGSDNVSVLSASSRSVLASVAVGAGPFGLAVDPVTATVYVTDQLSSNVSVLSVGSNAVVATVPVVYPFAGEAAKLQGVAYDPRDGYLWAGAGAFYAVVIDPGNETVADFVNTDPSGVVFDPTTGAVCVTNTANVTFACFVFPSSATPAASVAVTETGLPSATAWNFTLGSPGVTQSGAASSIAFGVLGPTYLSYTAWPAPGFAVNPASGVLNVSAAGVALNLTYVRSPGPYLVEFTESGLPAGTPWSVSLAGTLVSSTTSSVTFSVPSGTYAYRVGVVGGWSEGSLPVSGLVGVNGGPVTLPVLGFVPYTYSVLFEESGLPLGTGWSATLGGTTSSSSTPTIAFSVANGTYAYAVGAVTGYLESSPGASVTVDGTGVTVPVGFRPTYSVTFGEAGLPPSVAWNVTLGGSTRSSATDQIVFNETNGTLVFAITSPPGYSASPESGILVVAGTPVTEGISFTPVPANEYVVTFSETGLTPGIGWSVSVSNSSLAVRLTHGAVAPSPITFDLPNGTYDWGVFVPAGYSSGLSPGSLVVNGSAIDAPAVAFAPTAAGSGTGSGGSIPSWVLLGAGVILALAAGVGLGWLLLRSRSPPTGSS